MKRGENPDRFPIIGHRRKKNECRVSRFAVRQRIKSIARVAMQLLLHMPKIHHKFANTYEL